MKTNIVFAVLFLVALVINVTTTSAEESGDTVRLITTTQGKIAYLGYESGETKPPITPMLVFINSARPQIVSITVGIDGVDRSFKLKTEEKEKTKGAVAQLYLSKPDNSTSLLRGRKISVRAFAEKNAQEDYIILSLFFK
jgi:hypothetical protein